MYSYLSIYISAYMSVFYSLLLDTCLLNHVVIVIFNYKHISFVTYQEVRGHSMFLSPSDTTSRLSCLWRFVLEGYILDNIFLIIQFKHY